MSDKSLIEWTDATWNPVRGCVKISPGCKLCYAETFAERFRGVPGHPYEQGFDPRLVPDKLDEPLKWKRPRRIFVNSMSDLFLDAFPDDYIEQVCETMSRADWHIFQVLTKRSLRQMSFLLAHPQYARLKHVLWGVSVENRKHGVPRIHHLHESGARNTMLSIEPLLEDPSPLNLGGISWVIVGGESGHGARPMNPDWPRSIRDQSSRFAVPFFFKQWGEWTDYKHADAQGWQFTQESDGKRYGVLTYENGSQSASRFETRYPWHDQHSPGPCMVRVGNKAAGRLLDGREWNEQPVLR